MINTLFGSGNSLGKCRLHGAPRINRARRGRCSSSSREERRVVIIPRETGHPDSSLVQTDFSFFFFFFLPFSSWLCKHRDREYLCRRGRTRDGFVEGSGISLSLSFCWKVYSSPIESFTYIENFAAMYSYIQL